MSQASFLLNDAARAKVLAPFPLAKAYDYFTDAAPGDYVLVPLGRKETPGVVWDGAGDAALDPGKIRSVISAYDLPPLPLVHRQFIEKVAAYTLSDLGSVLKMTLSAPDVFDPPKGVTGYILASPSPRTCGERAGVRGSSTQDSHPSPSLSPQVRGEGKRRKVAESLSDGIPRRASEITKIAGCGAAIVKAMAAAGELVAVDMAAEPPGALARVPDSKLNLSQPQHAAAETLVKLARGKKFSTTLLDGVTGSGKTEVYFEAIAETLKQERQALVLLPEIALSAQFLERFKRRFGIAPALWHSEVSQAQRRVTWRGVAEGKTNIVIGARSALFLPYRDLGLIVVDEEHDASYKQEEGVLYNARDMAVLRGSLGEFPVVLVSATPSLETMTNVKQKKYGCLHLPERHAGAKMPQMHVVDLRDKKPERQRFISPPLKAALIENLAAGEQSLLFLNRRGYAPLTLCRTCGHRFQCPSCTAWLVEHKKHTRLQCHHCGHAQKIPKNCPTCNDADSLAACGPGVERIEEEIREMLPQARTLVLASDLTLDMAGAVKAIEDHEVDIIIGTQIVAKGHHFPSLTLVGVVDADLGLAGGDLRAGERTFQLLHQVAGRAGRGEKPGRVYLQTYMPEQMVIKALAANDRDRFLAAEAMERERAGMPPYGKLAALIVSDKDENKLDLFCRALARAAPQYDDIRVLGPAPAPMAFLRGKHRRRFLIKTGRGVAIQKYIEQWLNSVKVSSSIQLKTDIDPQSFY